MKHSLALLLLLVVISATCFLLAPRLADQRYAADEAAIAAGAIVDNECGPAPSLTEELVGYGGPGFAILALVVCFVILFWTRKEDDDWTGQHKAYLALWRDGSCDPKPRQTRDIVR